MSELGLALALIEERPELCHVIGVQPEALIVVAEQELDVSFPATFRAFALAVGAAAVGSEEIYGVVKADFAESGVPDAVWMTLEARRDWGLPDRMLVVYFDGGEDWFVLDGRAVGRHEEWPVVVWAPGRSRAKDQLELIAPDFGSFLLATVQKGLA